MDEIWEPVQYAVFRRMDGNVITGFTLKTLVTVVAGLLLGALIFVATGAITHVEQVPLGYAQAVSEQQRFADMASAVSYVEKKATTPTDKWELELGALRKYTLGAYTEEEVYELAVCGQKLGMTANTTAAEAHEMAPKTQSEVTPVLSGIERVALALAPAIFAGIFFFDYKGISLSREVSTFARWSRSQKRYYHR